MSTAPLAAGIPVTIENPLDWPEIASDFEKRNGTPPTVELSAVERFLGDCIALLFEADKVHNPELLRGSFADELVGKLLRVTVPVSGWAVAMAANVILIGVPTGLERNVVRIRANVQARDQDEQSSMHQQFWDLAFGDLTATVGTTNCPKCGAPLAQGAFVCQYCHADTRATAHLPIQVVRLERIS